MAKDKRDEKQSILGELESIKDLLNEDEFADIPTLSNDLSIDDLNVGDLNVDGLSANDLADIPVLTQTPDDIPILKPAHEVTEAELPQLDIPELNIPELDVPALEDTPDQLTTTEPTLDFNQELNLEPSADSAQEPSADLVQEPSADFVQEPRQEENLELDYDAETLPLQVTDSLLEQEIDSVEISTEIAEDLNLASAIDDFSLKAHSAKELDEDNLENFNLNEDSSFNESVTTVDSEAEDTESDSLVEDSNLQEESESLEDSDLHKINNTSEGSPDNGPLPELSKVPYALPGQQSLFESGSPTKSGSAAKEKNQTPESSQAESSLTEETYKKRSPKHGSSVTKARGENPFLPQHIRDRLHTSKTLVDIIKEHPPAPEKEAHPTNHIVEEIIADYMPKIEAELRERLLTLADKGTLEEYTQKEDRPDKAGPE